MQAAQLLRPCWNVPGGPNSELTELVEMLVVLWFTSTLEQKKWMDKSLYSIRTAIVFIKRSFPASECAFTLRMSFGLIS